MSEQVVTFRTAELAKAKDFIQPVFFYYSKGKLLNGIEGRSPLGVNYNNNQFDEELNEDEIKEHEWFSAPTQTQLQKWLRVEHDINICIWFNELTRKYRVDQPKEINTEFFSYEDALEFALQIGLISIK